MTLFSSWGGGMIFTSRWGGGGGPQWSGCNVRIRPRLLPANFTAYYPHSRFQFTQVHSCVLACAGQ